jgi:hypothetical protein
MFGSFWNEAWKEEEFYAALVTSTEFLFNRLGLKVDELPKFLSRFEIPTKAYQEIDFVRISELELKRKPVVLGFFIMDDGRTLDELQQTPAIWTTPSPVENASLITDSPVLPQLLWAKETDFDIVDGELRLYANPFSDEFKQHLQVIDEDNIKLVDIWLLDATNDENYLEDHYGRIVGMLTPSNEYYKKILNAVYDLLQEGATKQRLSAFIGSIVDTDVSKVAGQVSAVWDEGGRTWAAVGDILHSCPGTGRAIVIQGDTVEPGSQLFDVFKIVSGREVIDPGDFPQLVLGPAYVDTLSGKGLTFENAEIEVETYRFPIGGYEEDVEAFWTRAEANAVELGIDLEEAIIGDQKRPWTINPFDFIRSNFLSTATLFITADLTVVPDPEALKLLRYLDLVLPAGTTYFMNVFGIADEEDVPLCGDEELPGAYANDADELDSITITDYVIGREKLY